MTSPLINICQVEVKVEVETQIEVEIEVCFHGEVEAINSRENDSSG